jgi:hypothetical protein
VAAVSSGWTGTGRSAIGGTKTAAALETFGLTPALFAVINYLRAHEGTIQQQIGAAMGIDPSTMVSLVDQLERAGLAERRPRPQDRRAREVLITQSSRRRSKTRSFRACHKLSAANWWRSFGRHSRRRRRSHRGARGSAGRRAPPADSRK